MNDCSVAAAVKLSAVRCLARVKTSEAALKVVAGCLARGETSGFLKVVFWLLS